MPKAVTYQKGSIIYGNEAACQILGYDNLDTLKQKTNGSMMGLIYPEDVDDVLLQKYKVVMSSTDHMVKSMYRIISQNGQPKMIEEWAHMIHNEIYGNIFYSFIKEAWLTKLSRGYNQSFQGSGLGDKNEFQKQLDN